MTHQQDSSQSYYLLILDLLFLMPIIHLSIDYQLVYSYLPSFVTPIATSCLYFVPSSSVNIIQNITAEQPEEPVRQVMYPQHMEMTKQPCHEDEEWING
jgi:hypothetical protein